MRQKDYETVRRSGAMQNFFERVLHFIAGVFSDNGAPSSSRILTFMLSMFSTLILWGIFRYLKGVHDPTVVSAWMANMPMVIGGFAAFCSVPYTVNRGAGAITDIMNAVANLKSRV